MSTHAVRKIPVAIYSARSKASLEVLARDLRNLSENRKIKYLAYCWVVPLMLPPWYLRPLFALLKRLRGEAGFRSVIKWMNNKTDGDFLDGIEKDTLDHLLTGHDTEDRDSVGGFSQREINAIVHAAELNP
jgi:hypothetical protein